MASGVVIRLKNLPLAASTRDIRQFFNGLRIPDGGVHIIGGDDGTAFILFSTDEDARQAMLKDSEELCGASMKLMLSSHAEMKTVIEQSQKICEQLRGQRPPEPPITNLSTQSNVRSNQQSQGRYLAKIVSPAKVSQSLDANDVYIEIKSMPFSVSQADIVYFFSPLSVSAIKFMLDDKGRKNGSGFIKFATAIEKMEGLKRDRRFIGSRFVKLASATERQWLLANSQPCETVRLEAEITINRKRQQSHVSPDEITPKKSKDVLSSNTDTCVEISGLPSSATFKDVGDFFTRLQFVDGGLYVEMDSNMCKGIAYVEFKSFSDYKQALEKDGDTLNGKQVRVISLSKQNMIEKISIHKKYTKSKREEYEKEKLKENEHQSKKNFQLRKQKGMGEWLRRQHEKEESERKKFDSEKAVSQNVVEKKLLDRLFSDAKTVESLKQTGDFQLKEHLIKKLEEIAGTSSHDILKLEKMDEPLLGAGEMDIDDDNVPDQALSSSSKIQHNVVGSNASTVFPLLGTGDSGSVIASQYSLNFNPALPLLSPPFPPPNVQQISSTVSSNISNFPNSLVPMITKPFDTSQASSLNPPLLPINIPPPMSIPPPTLGPGPIPFPPPFNESLSQSSIPATAVMSSLTRTESITGKKSINSPVGSEYVRVANTPYNATERDIRNFFNGLNIPQSGIQFINKAKGKRSGHVFIKFSSFEDANKAVLKDDVVLMGRHVLVRPASLKLFNDIYEKLTHGQRFVPTFNVSENTKVGGDDSIFSKRILDDEMTCVCVGNLPASATKENVIKVLGDIKYLKSNIVLLRDAQGNCKGDAYVEVESPGECVKAANLHGNAEIGGQIIRVLPLTVNAMKKDLNSRQSQNANAVVSTSKTNGRTATENLKRMPFTSRQGSKTHTQQYEQKDHALLPITTSSVIDNSMTSQDLLNPILDPSLAHQPFAATDVLFSQSDDLLRLSSPNFLDPSYGLSSSSHLPPPPLSSTFFMTPPPMPFNSGVVAAVKMSNLSFKVTREDILEFFARFDPLPNSIRLMYNNLGKLTGDGLLAFASYEAAKAAVDQLHGKQFLSRRLKLVLQ